VRTGDQEIMSAAKICAETKALLFEEAPALARKDQRQERRFCDVKIEPARQNATRHAMGNDSR